MNQRPRCRLLLAGLLMVSAVAAAQPYRDADLAAEARVADLLPRMTTEEKFWQLFMLAGSLDAGVERYTAGAFGFQLGRACDGQDAMACANAIQRHFVEDTRLGIPVILFEESLHGLVQSGATAFPQAIGLAATFDADLMAGIAEAMAREGRARGIRQVLSPVVNLASDVRWGRTEETYGEDPVLTAAMGAAFVRGFEEHGVVATPKHLVANVGAGGRDSYPIHLGERELRETHLAPFEACFEAGARSVMTAYNSLDGIPCSANGWLNNRWLKDELGFRGFVISDAGAVGGANVLHFTASDYGDATAQALAGGLDVIFQTAFDHRDLFYPPFADGRIAPAVLDSAVARVLRVKFELGLFDQPYAGAEWRLTRDAMAAHRALARQAAAEAVVLLENRAATLPLPRDLETIAVLGPDADAARLGGYSGPGNDPVSILDGIRLAAGPSTEVLHAPGCTRQPPAWPTVPGSALTCSLDGSRRDGLRGEYFDNTRLAGAPVVTRIDPGVQFQWTLSSPDPAHLPSDFYSVRWTGRLQRPTDGPFRLGIEGTDGYRLFLDGALVVDNWQKTSAGRRWTTVPAGGHDLDLRLEYRETVGNARVRMIWDHGLPGDDDAALDRAVQLAADSDVAVVVVGLEEGEFRDRAGLALPGRQGELIAQVAATGTPTVVVVVGGSAFTTTGWGDQVSALLCAWYPGEAGGLAVADVLFGAVNPAGRLPISFPVSEGQLPLVYNHKPTGRGDDYTDLTGLARYPFGHGLSYTRFEYGDLRLDDPEIATTGSTTARITVTNVGGTAGDEVVQLYVRDEVASVARPVLALQGFERIHLAPGESREVSFELGGGQLALLDAQFRPVVEPGTYRVTVGASSRDIRARRILTVSPR